MTAPASGQEPPSEPMAALVHELNNVLSAILGYAEIVHADSGAGRVEERDAVQVLAATRRAIELTDQLAALISSAGSPALSGDRTGSEPRGPA